MLNIVDLFYRFKLMNLLQSTYLYFLSHQGEFWRAVQQHLALCTAALGISLGIGLPVGFWIARRARVAQVVINLFSILRVIPSLAILFVVLPYLGLGFLPALVALTFLAFPPVLINTYTGLRSVNPNVVEAAVGMGMAPLQVLARIEVPLAIPAIVTGIRVAAVEVISSATLAAFIGGGGLGNFITRGFALYDVSIMLVGAIPVALLALISELFWGSLLRFYHVKS